MRFLLYTLILLAMVPVNAQAQFSVSDADPPVPPNLSSLENIKRENVFDPKDDTPLPLDIRNDAIREAALSYGARGGLAWQTFHIRQELEKRGRYLDKVFNFAQLLIPAPSGLLIEPPIISESVNSMLINTSGQEAAVSDRIYNINANARIVSTARSWRNYLERNWGDVKPPPDILRPENAEERRKWREWVREGWEKGVVQANEIFEQDLLELSADFQGMVRYRMLLSQHMISPPYALQVDRGITGGGNSMRVGDRAIQITGKPALLPRGETWQPVNR